jgi:integrase
MSESHSTAPAIAGKPSKPNPEFPLFPHATGRWAKKIRGKLHYFGPWSDPDGALDKYLKDKDALHSGRTPRPETDGLTIKRLANAFLIAKQDLRDAGELTPRMWSDYKGTADTLVAEFGKHRLVADLGPDDFAKLRKKMARKWGPVTLGNAIQRVRCIFNYAADNGLIERTVIFGQGFARPSKKTLRLHRAAQGPKLFTREEIHSLLGAANTALKAMILLGVNAGYGNADVGTLPLSVVDLERGWVTYYRPKTGINRRCPLWPETIQAIREALADRPEPKKAEHAGLVFITKYGGSWGKETSDSPVAKETAKLLKSLHINGRKGLGFYTLRHVFRTIADEAKDQVAVDHMMGHAREDMASTYRERIDDGRLKAIADHVRKWLFGTQAGDSYRVSC